MKTLNIRHFIFCSLLAFSLASCGFQLKQSASLPASFGPVSITGIANNSTFFRAVRNALRQSSINITDSSSAKHTIRISSTRQRKVLSVNASGKVSEYELIQRLSYQVSSADGATVLATRTLSNSAFYTVSNTEVLGDISEEADIYNRLEERLVDQMFNQISASYANN